MRMAEEITARIFLPERFPSHCHGPSARRCCRAATSAAIFSRRDRLVIEGGKATGIAL